jgi:hypothetical protein
VLSSAPRKEGKQPEQALKTFKEMQQIDGVPDVITYSAVISAQKKGK